MASSSAMTTRWSAASPTCSERARRSRVAGTLCGVLLLAAGTAGAADWHYDRFDEPAPAWELAPGRDSQALRGRWVLLHFWATWCRPCREELPALARFAAGVAARGVTLETVAIDAGLDEASLAAWLAELPVAVPAAAASAGRVPAVYWTRGVPVTYLVDPQGRLVARMLGPRTWNDASAMRFLTGFMDPQPLAAERLPSAGGEAR